MIFVNNIYAETIASFGQETCFATDQFVAVLFFIKKTIEQNIRGGDSAFYLFIQNLFPGIMTTLIYSDFVTNLTINPFAVGTTSCLSFP